MKSSLCKKDYISISLTFLCVIFFYYARNGFVEISSLLWSEDGSIFLTEIYITGIASIFEPSAGYYHLYPRLVSLIVYFTDISFAPIIFLIATLIPLFMLVAVAYRFICSLGVNYILASFITLTAFSVPLTNEIYLNLTNIQWYIFILLFLVVVYDDSRSFLPKYIFYPLLVIFSLTGPFSIYIACVIVLKIFLDRFRFKLDDVVLYGIIFMSSLIQVVVIFLSGRTDVVSTSNLVFIDLFKKVLFFGSDQITVQCISSLFFIILSVSIFRYLYKHIKLEKDTSFHYFLYLVFCLMIYIVPFLLVVNISGISPLVIGSRYFFPIYFLIILLIPVVAKKRVTIILLLLILSFWVTIFIVSIGNNRNTLFYFDYERVEYPFDEFVDFAKVDVGVDIPSNPYWVDLWYIDIQTKMRTLTPLVYDTKVNIKGSEALSVDIIDLLKNNCPSSKSVGINLHIYSEASSNVQVVLADKNSGKTLPLKRRVFGKDGVYSIATSIDKYDAFQIMVFDSPVTINKIEVFCLK